MDGQMNRPNQFAPSTSLKLGHNNALMYKICP